MLVPALFIGFTVGLLAAITVANSIWQGIVIYTISGSVGFLVTSIFVAYRRDQSTEADFVLDA